MGRIDKPLNQLLLVMVILGIPVALVWGPLREYLWLAAEKAYVARLTMLLAVAGAYATGCFVTWAVGNAFISVFGKEPFSNMGNGEDESFDPWVGPIVGGLGYGVFVLKTLPIAVAMLGAGWCLGQMLQ